MVTATVEERLSRIEGAYEHLATKADVSQLEIRMVNSEARMIRWMVGLVLGGLGAGIGLTTFFGSRAVAGAGASAQPAPPAPLPEGEGGK